MIGFPTVESSRMIGRCELAHGDEPGRCTWCGKTLVGRQQRWCSESHAEYWYQNHRWTSARAEAIRRSERRCSKCGHTNRLTDAEYWWWSFLNWWCPRVEMKQNESWLDWFDRSEGDPIGEKWVAAVKLQQKMARNHYLEVNHVVPIIGRHGETGCHHHQSGLEVLCHACHVEVTSEQRAKGLLG